MFGQIFPATYGQDRLNPPYNVRLNVQTPDLANPLANLTPRDLDPAFARAMYFELSPDLATPYSYLYNFSWETEVRPGWRLQMGYLGSRAHKILRTYTFNRARVVPGVPHTTATVNTRRPNQSLFEHFRTANDSLAYYDAARISLTVPNWRGLTFSTSYWFSKSIDLGSDYTNTGGGNDRFGGSGQTELYATEDLKALSNFDQPHSFLLQASYDTGRKTSGFLQRLYSNWNVSGVFLLKSGTPFSVDSGADGPGFGNVDGTNGDRPMLVDPSVLGRIVGNPDTSRQLLPKSAFRFISAPGELAGNLGKNVFRKGKIANFNFGLSRTWTLPNDLHLTFRAESINFSNTPQFAEPGRSLTLPNFGQITNTLNDGRTFRFLLRINF
jgi:hypothetical protein